MVEKRREREISAHTWHTFRGLTNDEKNKIPSMAGGHEFFSDVYMEITNNPESMKWSIFIKYGI